MRPNLQHTLKALLRGGIEYNVYFVCSDDDETVPTLMKLYPNIKILLFNRGEIKKKYKYNYFYDGKGVVDARNACYFFAEKLGLDFFCEMDDDYKDFYCQDSFVLPSNANIHIKNLNGAFDASFALLKESSIDGFAWGQTGDFIGGKRNVYKRKMMNIMFLKTAGKIYYTGNINEDVNVYAHYGMQGKVFITDFFVYTIQPTTQRQSGGMTGIYKDKGVYVKSFTSFVYTPNVVSLGILNATGLEAAHPRIHHTVKYSKMPRIIKECDVINADA